jgi:hypothetical protein
MHNYSEGREGNAYFRIMYIIFKCARREMRRDFKGFFKKRFKTDNIIIFCVYLTVPFMLAVMLRTVGTPNPDNQMTNGTIDHDHIIQLSYGDDDTQVAAGQPGNDKITQDGGTEDDLQGAAGNDGDDVILQRGKAGNDLQYAEGNDGNDKISQLGAEGDDFLIVFADQGNDTILQNSGPGDDFIVADGGPGNDKVKILAGDDMGGNTDYISYWCSPGNDEVFIDGGPGYDILFFCPDGCIIEDDVSIRQSSIETFEDGKGCNGVGYIGDTRLAIRRVEECIIECTMLPVFPF